MVSRAVMEELRQASRRARRNASQLLDDDLDRVAEAVRDGRELKPDTADPELYDQLIAEVRTATAANESRSRLRERIGKLGKAGARLAKELARTL